LLFGAMLGAIAVLVEPSRFFAICFYLRGV
jgi:hypothetical protein